MTRLTMKQKKDRSLDHLPVNTRVFNGRTFYLQQIFKDKGRAQRLVERTRIEGSRARLVEKNGKYIVYVG